MLGTMRGPNLIEAGGGVVLNDRGEFLVILRNGIWDLPKGKLEKGEDFATAAMREVEEETGLHGLKMLDPLSSTYHTYNLKGKRILKKMSTLLGQVWQLLIK